MKRGVVNPEPRPREPSSALLNKLPRNYFYYFTRRSNVSGR